MYVLIVIFRYLRDSHARRNRKCGQQKERLLWSHKYSRFSEALPLVDCGLG